MRPRLVSLNFGMTLVVRVDGEDRKIRFSGVFPSKTFKHIQDVMWSIAQFFNEELGTFWYFGASQDSPKVLVAKSKQEEPAIRIDQEQFIRELVGR